MPTLAVITLVLVVYALVSHSIEKRVSGPVIFLTLGILVSEPFLGWVTRHAGRTATALRATSERPAVSAAASDRRNSPEDRYRVPNGKGRCVRGRLLLARLPSSHEVAKTGKGMATRRRAIVMSTN